MSNLALPSCLCIVPKCPVMYQHVVYLMQIHAYRGGTDNDTCSLCPSSRFLTS